MFACRGVHHSSGNPEIKAVGRGALEALDKGDHSYEVSGPGVGAIWAGKKQRLQACYEWSWWAALS